MPNKLDIYTEITNKIISALEAGTPPWHCPWTGSTSSIGFPLRSTSQPYRGINILMLWLAASDEECLSRHWFTYKQAKTLGGQVRKGEKATRVVYYSTLERESEDGEDITIPYLKTYGVFNADQIEQLPQDFYVKLDPARDLGTEPDSNLEAIFARSGAKTRLDRNHDAKRSAYAFEELVAEIGACMICAQIGVTPDYPQTAAYIESWLECLKQDKKAIFKAASLAQQAADYILKPEDRAE